MPNSISQTPSDFPYEMTQNFYFGECLGSDDPLMLGRIRAIAIDENYDQRVGSAKNFDPNGSFEKNGPWSDQDPFIFLPFLPYFINQVPKVKENCLIFYFDRRNRTGNNKFYMIAPYSSPTTIEFEDRKSSRTRLASGKQNSTRSLPPIKNGDGEYKNPLQNKGVFVEPMDISINGRDTADMILKNNELVLRAGKHLPFERGQIPVSNTKRAFLQLTNFDKKTSFGDPTEYKVISNETQKIKYLIEYYCLTPETQADVFTGGVLIYGVPDNPFSNEMDVRFFGNNTNYTGETNLIYQKQLTAISGVTNFAKEIKDVLVAFKDNPRVITSVPDGQQFPFFYRGDNAIRKILTDLTGNIDYAKVSNMANLKDEISISATDLQTGYGLVLNKKLDNELPLKVLKETVTPSTTEKIDNTIGLLGANQLYFLSHETVIEGKNPITLEGTVYGIDYPKIVESIEPNTSSMVRGDELMDLLQLIVEFLVTHDHPYPQLPPTPVSKSSGISTQEVLTKMQEAYQKVLNKNIRIN
jgi:hypothetical protein